MKCPVEASEEEKEATRLPYVSARKAAGKEPADFAHILGNEAWCWDLEYHGNEFFYGIGLRQLTEICAELGIKSRDLFSDVPSEESAIGPTELLERARDYLRKSGLSLAEFEDRIGFCIGPTLADPSQMSDWSVDFLRWLCAELDLDWRRALPNLSCNHTAPWPGG